MNELYNETVTRQGKVYRYDPDQDIYYREQELSRWDQFGWLVIMLALAALAAYFEFWPIR